MQNVSDQSIFDTVAKHLLTQGVRAGSIQHQDTGVPDFICSFRDEDGHKCAFGALIPDENYVPEMEKYNVTRLIMLYPELNYLQPHTAICNRLRQTHDYRDPSDWRSALAEVAREFNLNTDVLQG